MSREADRMKKNRNLFSAVLFLCAAVLAAAWSAVPVSAEEPAEDKTVRIGIIAQNGYATLESDGSCSGANVELAYRMAQYANMKISIVLPLSGKEAMEMMDDGRLDIMCNVLKTPDREREYLFSEHEAGTNPMCVYVKRDSRFEYNNVGQLKTMKFGAEESSKVREIFTEWCGKRDIRPDITIFPDTVSVSAAVDAGTIDAGLYGGPSVEGYRSIQTFSPIPYYFIFRKTDGELKNRVDDAMEKIFAEDPTYLEKLVRKYVSPDEFEMEAMTADEMEYIHNHPQITVSVLEDDEPYYYRDKDGSDAGIVPDFYEKMEKATGLQFVYKRFKTQSEAIDAIKSGQADVLGMYSNGQIPAYEAGLRITRPYANVDMVLVTKAGTGISDIREIAVKNRSRNYVQMSVSSSLHAEFKGYNTTIECLNALKNGRVDGMICGLPSATWLINQNNASAYSIVTISPATLEICAATSYENGTLCSVLSKAVGTSSYSFNEIMTNNTLPQSNVSSLLSRIPPVILFTALAFLLLLVIALIWTIILLVSRQKEKAEIMAKAAENERKNQFFSNISHDMRTPLNAIMGFSNMARKKDISEEQRDDYLTKIQSSGNLLLNLINDTLTVSKINSGKLELHPEPVLSTELIESIVTPVRQTAEKKNLHFTVDTTGIPARTIMADRLNVQKIFLNILSNAVKYTPEGGNVAVTVGAREIAKGRVSAAVVVTDDGIGISKEFLPHIFEPFEQEGRRGYESGGTGLGLSIVKQIVELMGGTVEVQSEKNKGTVFTVELTFDEIKTADKKEAGEETVPEADLRGKKVLLCEDNALNREIAVALLKERGISADTAENGKEGVQKFYGSLDGEYAAILMDVRMPVMDGYEATRAIRVMNRKDAGTVPIIAMTADAFQDDVEKCRKAGMNGHISKPVDPEKMMRVISGNIRT
jgi:signal transduction histidine kinase/ABC-type amino acid transport substrate-binding protein